MIFLSKNIFHASHILIFMSIIKIVFVRIHNLLFNSIVFVVRKSVVIYSVDDEAVSSKRPLILPSK